MIFRSPEEQLPRLERLSGTEMSYSRRRCLFFFRKVVPPAGGNVLRNGKTLPSQEVRIFPSAEAHLPRLERISGPENSYLLRRSEIFGTENHYLPEWDGFSRSRKCLPLARGKVAGVSGSALCAGSSKFKVQSSKLGHFWFRQRFQLSCQFRRHGKSRHKARHPPSLILFLQ